MTFVSLPKEVNSETHSDNALILHLHQYQSTVKGNFHLDFWDPYRPLVDSHNVVNLASATQDGGSDILDNCATNVRLNSRLLKYPETSILVRELDWKGQWPPSGQTFDSESQRLRYSWTSAEVMEAEEATVLLAADVIYSNDLTDAFFGILKRLMLRGSKKVLYLALEKRYNFSVNELDVVANGYAHFRSFLHDDLECYHPLPCFKGEQVDVGQIPQYIREYERGKDVELWKITYCSKF